MVRESQSAASSLASTLRTFRRPWPLLLAGLVCVVIGLILSQPALVPLRLLSLGGGLLLAGGAVARRLQTASWDLLEDRAESAGLLAMAALLAGLAYLSMEKSWDSGRYFLLAVVAVALVGSFLVLLPRTARRVAAVVLVVLHFGGIVTAVTSVPPRNEQAPWIPVQLWVHFYRHYLTFAYLTNAYHFYSPDPGPPTLLWFHVEYANGKARWIKIPNRRESPIGLHHQRMLATAESSNVPIMGPPLLTRELIEQSEAKFGRKYELLPGIPHDNAEEIMVRRRKAGENSLFIDPNDGRPAPLKVLDELPPWNTQYSEPQEMARRLTASYARHIVHTAPPDQDDPGSPVKAVRVYRVIHTLISPRELHEGKDPLDPTTFVPFYMGKYDPDGRLLDPKDPYLFWHIPIVRVPKSYPEKGTLATPEGTFLITHWPEKSDEPTKIIDFVEIHATQSDRFMLPTPKK